MVYLFSNNQAIINTLPASGNSIPAAVVAGCDWGLLSIWVERLGHFMGMTDSQFKGFIGFVLDDIKEMLENLEDGSKEKDKLQKVADNLQQTLED